MKRIPYSQDHGIEPTCFVCCAGIGQLHKAGCWDEHCPSCGGRLVTCGCRVLSADAEARALCSIYGQIKGLVYAWRFLATFRLDSIMARAALAYVATNAPDVVHFSFSQEGAWRGFPRFEASGYRPEGTPVFTSQDIAQALGRSPEEIHALSEALAGIDAGREVGAICRVQ